MVVAGPPAGTLGLLDEVAADVAGGCAPDPRRRLRHRGDGRRRRRGDGPPWRSTASTRRPGCSRSRGGAAAALDAATAARASGYAQALADRLPFEDGDVRPRAVGVRAPARAVALPGAARDAPGPAPGRAAGVRDLAAGRRAVRGRRRVRRRAARRRPGTALGRRRGRGGRGRRGRRGPDDDRGNDDVPSPEAAVAQLRRAGFSGARARADTLVHPFTPEGYVGFVTRFDDEDEFATMDAGRRDDARAPAPRAFARVAAVTARHAAPDRVRHGDPDPLKAAALLGRSPGVPRRPRRGSPPAPWIAAPRGSPPAPWIAAPVDRRPRGSPPPWIAGRSTWRPMASDGTRRVPAVGSGARLERRAFHVTGSSADRNGGRSTVSPGSRGVPRVGWKGQLEHAAFH